MLNCVKAVNKPTTLGLLDTLTNMDVEVLNSILAKHTSTSTKQIEDYRIGDILWTKIGKYPYWPSIVCTEPALNIYYSKLYLSTN